VAPPALGILDRKEGGVESTTTLFSYHCGSRTCKPNSVRRIAPGGTAIPLGPASLRGSSDLPGGLTRRAGACAEPKFRAPSLFGLAPCGVCPARCITAAAVRSYRTFSPLLRRCRRGGIFSVALSVNRAWTRPPGRYPAHCSAEFGLSSLITWRDKSGRPVQLPT